MSKSKLTKVQRFDLFCDASGKCFWCGCELNLDLFHADHLIPCSIQKTNAFAAFVASCLECNLAKGNFNGPIDETRKFIRQKRGLPESKMPESVCSDKAMAEILQQFMSDEKLVE